ncbi:16528_t:CDS:2 [Rhizophagus irregularis]|nr:16528_t:CDS:2 [Rhizophagus irregularis]
MTKQIRQNKVSKSSSIVDDDEVEALRNVILIRDDTVDLWSLFVDEISGLWMKSDDSTNDHVRRRVLRYLIMS